MRSIRTAERRTRLAQRHDLGDVRRAGAVDDIVRDLVCLHATDPATVYLSTWARMRDPSVAAIDEALYRERGVVRTLAMRRTMFVVARDELPILQSAVSWKVALRERKRNEDLAALLGVADAKAWLGDAEAATLDALHELGEASAQELSAVVPALRRKVRVNVGKKYEGDIGMSSRILIVLALAGRIIRGRPRGTWISSQYRWTLVEDWLGGPIRELSVATAQAALIGRWLARFGPGTEMDMRWWSGLTAREVRAALAATNAVEVDLDGETGYVLSDDERPTGAVDPWVALLPPLDPTVMGWQSRAWYLGPHKAAIFDSVVNAGPTIWCDGRLVVGWSFRDDGEVATRLLEDIGNEAGVAIDQEAERLSRLLGRVRVYPRFTTPLQRELSG
jgi:hypothetical protein